MADTVDADMRASDLLIKYSRRPEMASVFNYASMAHNNHFFFNSLVSMRMAAFLCSGLAILTQRKTISHPIKPRSPKSSNKISSTPARRLSH